MEKLLKHQYPFSFWNGFRSFFALRDRRIDVIKAKMSQVKDIEAIRQDWLQVGSDLKESVIELKKIEPTLTEEECNA